jgi:hypothetical protein
MLPCLGGASGLLEFRASCNLKRNRQQTAANCINQPHLSMKTSVLSEFYDFFLQSSHFQRKEFRKYTNFSTFWSFGVQPMARKSTKAPSCSLAS